MFSLVIFDKFDCIGYKFIILLNDNPSEVACASEFDLFVGRMDIYSQLFTKLMRDILYLSMQDRFCASL